MIGGSHAGPLPRTRFGPSPSNVSLTNDPLKMGGIERERGARKVLLSGSLLLGSPRIGSNGTVNPLVVGSITTRGVH